MIAERIKKPIYLTHILIAINVIIFGIMWLIDPQISTMTLANFGAKVNFLLVDGEWYRLISPMFLHVDFFHLLFNCMALASFGIETELIFGKKKFLIIYFVSGIAGSVGSFVFSSSVSAGASGAIFGLIGANLYLLTLNREVYKRVFGNSILVLLAINIAYGITNPIIDDSAHIAGLIGGFLITWSIGHLNQATFDFKNHLARVVLIIALVGGLTFGYYKNWQSEDYYLYKGAFQIESGDILNAELTFIEASKKYPQNEEFLTVIEQIKTYKNSMDSSEN